MSVGMHLRRGTHRECSSDTYADGQQPLPKSGGTDVCTLVARSIGRSDGHWGRCEMREARARTIHMYVWADGLSRSFCLFDSIMLFCLCGRFINGAYIR